MFFRRHRSLLRLKALIWIKGHAPPQGFNRPRALLRLNPDVAEPRFATLIACTFLSLPLSTLTLSSQLRSLNSSRFLMFDQIEGVANYRYLHGRKLTDGCVLCFIHISISQVPPGEYRLAAAPVASADSSPSPVFGQAFLDVKVESPLLDLEFSQSQVSIHGEVHCKDTCSSDVLLSLVRLTGKLEQERKMIKMESDSGEFVITKVFPGKYTLEITRAKNKWCLSIDQFLSHNAIEVPKLLLLCASALPALLIALQVSVVIKLVSFMPMQ